MRIPNPYRSERRAAVIALLSGLPALAQCPGSWSGMSTGMNNSVYALTAMPNGDAIAAGFFTAAGGTSAIHIARWDGAAWNPLGPGLPEFSGYARALTVLPNGDIVAGGLFLTAGTLPANGVAQWNGTSWSALSGLGVTGITNVIDALVTLPSGEVIAGGSFGSTGPGGNRVDRWNGASWSQVPSTDSTVVSLAVQTGGDFVAGGGFTMAGTTQAASIAHWNAAAGNWSAMGSGASNFVWALTVLPNGDVIAGGDFLTMGGAAISRIARWNGSTWSALGSGMNGPVYALCALPGGDFIAGGEFTLAGGIPAARIARWDSASSTWAPMSVGMNSTVRAVTALPNGDIIAGGDFSTAGGFVCSCISRWSQASAPSFTAQPQAASTCPSGSANFSITAAGTNPITYQWQIETSPGTWQNLTLQFTQLPCGGTATASAATTNQTDIAIAACPTVGSYQVRCIATNTCGTTTSDPATYSVCFGNCDCSTVLPLLNANDFQCFLNRFAAGSTFANCDGSTVPPVLNANDFQCFLNQVASGCP